MKEVKGSYGYKRSHVIMSDSVLSLLVIIEEMFVRPLFLGDTVLSSALVTELEGKTYGSKNQGKANTDVCLLFLTSITIQIMQDTHEEGYFAKCIKLPNVGMYVAVKVVTGCVSSNHM